MFARFVCLDQSPMSARINKFWVSSIYKSEILILSVKSKDENSIQSISFFHEKENGIEVASRVPDPGSNGTGFTFFWYKTTRVSVSKTKILALLLNDCLLPIAFSLLKVYSSVCDDTEFVWKNINTKNKKKKNICFSCNLKN